jgi:hypothetical protein
VLLLGLRLTGLLSLFVHFLYDFNTRFLRHFNKIKII